MKKSYPTYYFKLVLSCVPICLFVACQNSGEEYMFEDEMEQQIHWNVQSVTLEDSRSLIGDNEMLIKACTPALGGQAIGIWSAQKLNGNQNEIPTQNVLGNPTGDVRLIYDEGTAWENWNGWTYGIMAVYWKINATYYFNAYYPKEGGMTDIKQTTTSISGKYNTTTTQNDFMLCRQIVDTSADNFTAAPVPLLMKHALAALRFQFESNSKYPKYVQSFALKNESTNGLATSGTITYQDGDINIANWAANTPTTGDIYAWEHPSDGVAFTNTEKAIAYQAATNTVVGNVYTENDGWVLTIPQTYNGGTKMSFTIDGEDYEVELPKKDFLPGTKYTYLIKVTGGEKVTLECVAQPWDLVETTNEFSTVVSVLEQDRINWTAGSHYDNDADPNNNEQIVLWDDINNPAEFSFKIAHPLGGTWHAVLRTISGATDAFELRDTEGNIKMDGAVGEEVTLRVCAKRENTTTVSNVAELMFVVRSSGHILPVDMITVLGEGQNYKIVQNINK